MTDSFPSFFHTNISLLVLIAIITISVVFTFYLYRKTTPPISNSWRIFLAILRFLSLAGILILLFAPELSVIWYQDKLKSIVIAVDRSSSMGIAEAGRKRSERANQFAAEFADKYSDIADIRLYSFNSDTLAGVMAENDTTFGGTDYSRSITSIVSAEESIDELILLTDGNLTMGNDPLYLSLINMPRISTIGYGDTIEVTDLIIMDVRSNDIVYEGKPVQLQVELMLRGKSGINTILTVKQNGKIIAAENIDLNNTGSIMSKSLEITPYRTGINRYVIEISGIENEKNVSNNRYVKTINVRKGKIKTGLIASKIDFDTKFLISLLEKNDEIDFSSSVIPASRPPFFNNITKIINEAEVLILYNFPSGSRYWQELTVLSEQKSPVLMIMNERITSENVEFIKRFLPIRSMKNSGQTFHTQVVRTMSGKLFPQLNVFDSENQNMTFWEKCPPIQIPFYDIKYGPGVTVLLESKSIQPQIKTKIPVLLSYRSAGTKSMIMFGSGFWRWHFSLAEDKEYNKGWSHLLKNIVRWLGSGNKDKNVILTTGKKTFELGEYISPVTQVYDGSFNPVDDAVVQTEISGPGGKFEIYGDSNGQGTYSSRFMTFAEGDYQIRTTAFKNDIKLGSDSLNIFVIPVNREFMFTNQNYTFLQQLSEKFNGKYYHENIAKDLPDDLDLSPKRERQELTVELWHKMAILIIILILLSVEWFIRKRLGLA